MQGEETRFLQGDLNVCGDRPGSSPRYEASALVHRAWLACSASKTQKFKHSVARPCHKNARRVLPLPLHVVQPADSPGDKGRQVQLPQLPPSAHLARRALQEVLSKIQVRQLRVRRALAGAILSASGRSACAAFVVARVAGGQAVGVRLSISVNDIVYVKPTACLFPAQASN